MAEDDRIFRTIKQALEAKYGPDIVSRLKDKTKKTRSRRVKVNV